MLAAKPPKPLGVFRLCIVTCDVLPWPVCGRPKHPNLILWPIGGRPNHPNQVLQGSEQFVEGFLASGATNACCAVASRLRCTMPVVQEVRHPRSLDFANERKVVLLRDIQGCSWDSIRRQVRNLRGHMPSVSLLKRVHKGFKQTLGRRPYKYQNCGRRPSKSTKAVQKFLVQRLLALRLQCVCTSLTLQRELLSKKGVHLDASSIRKVLRKHGYHWLPKAQKRKYSAPRRAERLRFARAVVQLSRARLREKLSFSMDGVILALPPRDPTDRANYCAHGDGHMWRQRGECWRSVPGSASAESCCTSLGRPLGGRLPRRGFPPSSEVHRQRVV